MIPEFVELRIRRNFLSSGFQPALCFPARITPSSDFASRHIAEVLFVHEKNACSLLTGRLSFF
jgi:hypothetical protein